MSRMGIHGAYISKRRSRFGRTANKVTLGVVMDPALSGDTMSLTYHATRKQSRKNEKRTISATQVKRKTDDQNGSERELDELRRTYYKLSTGTMDNSIVTALRPETFR